jgi:hypothetical protein
MQAIESQPEEKMEHAGSRKPCSLNRYLGMHAAESQPKVKICNSNRKRKLAWRDNNACRQQRLA